MPEHQQTQKPGKPDSTFQKQAALTSQNPVSHPASIIQRVRINPKSLTSADVLQLQRTIGNRAVGKLLSEIRNPSKIQQVPIQRQEIPEEEEPLQGKFENEPEKATCPSCIQRQEIPEEEEPLQGKFETIQRLEPEEEKLQMKSVVQRQKMPEEEEPLQGKMVDPVQRQEIPEGEEPIQGKMIGTVQRQEIPEEEEPLQKKSENNTGMPDNLKAGVESLSGIDMSDVRVHYNSSKPAEVGALAYTQGTDIHVASGQERHLPHEAWHVVQQKQGRVKPTMQLKDMAVNDDMELEREASEIGNMANTIQPIQKYCGELPNSKIFIQRAKPEDWETIETIDPGKEEGTVFSLSLREKKGDFRGDFEIIHEACSSALNFYNKYQQNKKLLHIGVGVGDPKSTLAGNPSIDTRGDILDSQMNPGFITDAASKNYAIVVMNFNTSESGKDVDPKVDDKYPKLTINVGARFPLINRSKEDQQATETIFNLRKQVDLFSLMNSVSDVNYPNLLDIVAPPIPKLRGSASYLKSYAHMHASPGFPPFRGEENSWSYAGVSLGKKRWSKLKPDALTHFSDMSQVFPSTLIQFARTNPKSLPPADVLQLQRTIGNRAVGRLLSGIGGSSTAQQAIVQRQEVPEEEKPLQDKFEGNPEDEICPSCSIAPIVQRQDLEGEESLQDNLIETIQRQKLLEERELLQGKYPVICLQRCLDYQKITESQKTLPERIQALLNYLNELDIKVNKICQENTKDNVYTVANEFWERLGQAQKQIPECTTLEELNSLGEAYVDALNIIYKNIKSLNTSSEGSEGSSAGSEPALSTTHDFSPPNSAEIKKLKLTGNDRPITRKGFDLIMTNAQKIMSLKGDLLDESRYDASYSKMFELLNEIRMYVQEVSQQRTPKEVAEYFTFSKGLTAELTLIYKRFEEGESMCNETDVALPLLQFLEINKPKFKFF